MLQMLIKCNIAIVCEKRCSLQVSKHDRTESSHGGTMWISDGRQLDCRWTSLFGSGLLGHSNEEDRVFLVCLKACP